MSGSAGAYYVPHGSHWPILGSIGLFTTMIGFALMLNDASGAGWVMIAGLCTLIYMMFGWFGEVIGESERRIYNDQVDTSFRLCMMWFIFSEIMFFAAFFAALFYCRQLSVPWLAETPLLWPDFGGGWPTAGPAGLDHIGPDQHEVRAGEFATIGPWGIPLLNTALLLISSVTMTIAHHALRAGHRMQLIVWLAITVLLGAIFLYYQAQEYSEAYGHLGLTLGTGVYGATFFMLTGFHGFHVTVGAIILFFIWLRCIRGHFDEKHHFAFEAGAWYWHFVDTVWVGLFIFVYVL